MSEPNPQSPDLQTPPAAAMADPFADLRDPTNNLLFGKYTTPEAAKAGVWEQNRFIGDLVARNKELEGRVNPAVASGQHQSAVAALAKEGMLPPDLLQRAIEEVASRQLEAAFRPIQDTFQARTNLSASLPEFIANEADIMRWAATQPQINTQIQQLQAAGFAEPALRLATREWQASRVATSPPVNSAPAALPATSLPAGGGGRSAPATGPTPEDFNSAMTMARRGDDRALSNMLWKDFNWFGPQTELS